MSSLAPVWQMVFYSVFYFILKFFLVIPYKLSSESLNDDGEEKEVMNSTPPPIPSRRVALMTALVVSLTASFLPDRECELSVVTVRHLSRPPARGSGGESLVGKCRGLEQ